MSQQNVEIAQRFSKAFERASRAYWKDPRSLEDGLKTGDLSPEAAELISHLHPEIEWKTAFSLAGEVRRGHIEFARFCDEWLEATEDYTVTVRDVTDLEDDRVFIVSDLEFKGKGTGIEVNGVSYAAVTVREGLIARIDEYSSRNEALEALGMSEQDAHADS
jgi:ketosteroid isomerase-like protein